MEKWWWIHEYFALEVVLGLFVAFRDVRKDDGEGFITGGFGEERVLQRALYNGSVSQNARLIVESLYNISGFLKGLGYVVVFNCVHESGSKDPQPFSIFFVSELENALPKESLELFRSEEGGAGFYFLCLLVCGVGGCSERCGFLEGCDENYGLG